MSVTRCPREHPFDLECPTCAEVVFDQVRRSASWIADRPQDADDIVSEALEGIVRSTRRGHGWVPGEATLRTWAAAVTRHAATQQYRNQQRLRRLTEMFLNMPRSTFADALLEVEYVRSIETYLEGIRPAEAEAVRLAIFEEHTNVEIARKLGATPQWWGRQVNRHLAAIARLVIESGP